MTAWLRDRLYALPTAIALLVFLALSAWASPAFVMPANWNGLLVGAAPYILTALAQAPVILSGDGGIDLSVGPLAGVVNALITATLASRGWSDPVAVLGVTLAVGIASGLLNGALVAIVRVQPIIATLGTYLIYQGLALELLPQAGGSAPAWLRGLAETHGGIPGILALLLPPIAVWLLLGRSAFRRNLLGIGGDPRAAYASGVHVASVRIGAYVFGGVLAACAGLAFTAALGSGDPKVGTPYTLTSIAAVALGGVALTGGRGGLLGAGLAGALLFVIQTLFTLAQVSIFYLQIAYGAILIAALVLNAAGERVRMRRAQAA